jgi:orotate phosphoribosyltransferase
MTAARETLRTFVAGSVVRHATADIELASGRLSDFYFDGRSVTLSGESLALFAQLVIEEARRLGATAIGGPTIGADPVVGATLALAATDGAALKGFLVRKEPKARGLRKQVEGPALAGERALLVEDTVTSGGSLLMAAEALRREHPACEIVGAVALVDRQEGGAEALAAAGVPLVAVFAKSDFPEAG